MNIFGKLFGARAAEDAHLAPPQEGFPLQHEDTLRPALVAKVRIDGQASNEFTFLQPGSFRIGRSQDKAHIVIPDPSKHVSREHFALHWDGVGISLQDLKGGDIPARCGNVPIEVDSPVHVPLPTVLRFLDRFEVAFEVIQVPVEGDISLEPTLPEPMPAVDAAAAAALPPAPPTAPPPPPPADDDQLLVPAPLASADAIPSPHFGQPIEHFQSKERGTLLMGEHIGPGGTVAMQFGEDRVHEGTKVQGESPSPERRQEFVFTRDSAEDGDEPLDTYQSLKRQVYEKLVDELRKPGAPGTPRQRGEQILRVLLREAEIGGFDRARLQDDIIKEAFELGPITDYMEDPTVSEIMVVGHTSIYVERHGVLAKTERRFATRSSLLSVIERIVERVGRQINTASPMVDARLPDGSRVNAVIPPVALRGACLTIRKFRRKAMTLEEMVQHKSMSTSMALFLRRCVKAKKNIIIAGGTGSGKTSLLNTLSLHIGERERLVTIEDAAELQLQQPHVIAMESRPANVEGRGEITLSLLLRNALRMRPDRIIVGECRGGEALDMLQAMNTGHEGSLTTAHANSPEDLLGRLEVMVLQAGVKMPVEAIREMIGAALHVIVHQARLTDGRRVITSISEVMGYDRRENRIRVEPIFEFRRRGIDEKGRVEGDFRFLGHLPSFTHEFKVLGLLDDGPTI